jgi:hypothetical protein
MDNSISSITQSLSRLAIYVLWVRTDMNDTSDRITAQIQQIQQLTAMVKALSNQDLPRKQQHPPTYTSPAGLTLQNVQVPGSTYLNRSKSPTSSTARSTTQGKSSWADQHEDEDDDDEMENAEYRPGNKDTTCSGKRK